MRCPARFIAATALAAVSLVPLSGVSRAAGGQPSLPSALASFLAEEAHASSSEREALLAGNPLVTWLDADPSKRDCGTKIDVHTGGLIYSLAYQF